MQSRLGGNACAQLYHFVWECVGMRSDKSCLLTRNGVGPIEIHFLCRIEGHEALC